MILDYKMPGKNGDQVVKEVNQLITSLNAKFVDFEIKPPTIAFVTAYATPYFRDFVGNRLGIKFVFDKPMMLDDLKCLVAECTCEIE